MQPKLFSTVQKLSAVIFVHLIFKSDLAGYYFKNSGVCFNITVSLQICKVLCTYMLYISSLSTSNYVRCRTVFYQVMLFCKPFIFNAVQQMYTIAKWPQGG